MLHFVKWYLSVIPFFTPTFREICSITGLILCFIIKSKEKKVVFIFGLKMGDEKGKLLEEAEHVEKIVNPEETKIGDNLLRIFMIFEVEVGKKTIWYLFFFF